MIYSKKELDIVPGMYKCVGDISCLRFKARLEVIKSSMIPLSGIDDSETGLDPQYFEREEIEFGWNEKIFNSHEIEYYSNTDRNFKTALDQEYRDRVKNFRENNAINQSQRLFTYTSKDEIPESLHKNILHGEDYGGFNFFQDHTVMKRLPLSRLTNKTDENDTDENYANIVMTDLPIRNIVDNNLSESLRRRNRHFSKGSATMYVVADLCDKTHISQQPGKGGNCKNHLLFTIIWNKRNSTLNVMPDLTSLTTTGYKIEVDKLGDTRYVYRYWLMDVSEAIEDIVSSKTFNEQLTPHHEPHLNLEFDLPLRNTKNIFLFIEIQKAIDFECDDMFIKYYVDLPKNWSSNNTHLLQGITQQCYSRKDIFYPSCLIELKLIEDGSNNDYDIRNTKPQLFLEICSLDNWNRFRIEGYATMILPLVAGCHKIVLCCWRSKSSSCRDELKRYFIGMDEEISDIIYTGVQNDICNRQSRFNFETTSSGSIHICVNTIVQHDTATNAIRRGTNTNIQVIKTDKLLKNVNNILESFQRARDRMISAKKPILEQKLYFSQVNDNK